MDNPDKMEHDKILVAFLFTLSMAGAFFGFMKGNHDLAVFAGGFATFWSGALSTLLLTKKNGNGNGNGSAPPTPTVQPTSSKVPTV